MYVQWPRCSLALLIRTGHIQPTVGRKVHQQHSGIAKHLTRILRVPLAYHVEKFLCPQTMDKTIYSCTVVCILSSVDELMRCWNGSWLRGSRSVCDFTWWQPFKSTKYFPIFRQSLLYVENKLKQHFLASHFNALEIRIDIFCMTSFEICQELCSELHSC